MITATNPTGQTIEFNEDKHIYTVRETGQKLISGTTFINKFFEPFNTDAVTKKCLLKPEYSGMTVDEIKQLWKNESERGSSEGTNVHDFAHKYFIGEPTPKPLSTRCVKLFKIIINTIEGLKKYYKFVAAEKIVFSSQLGIAGTIDLLMECLRTDDIVILDWKQNKEIKTENRWQKGLKPIQHLDECDFVKYSLQTNLYKKILLTENYYPGKNIRLGLIHLKEGEKSGINLRVDSLDKEIEDMLKEIKK